MYVLEHLRREFPRAKFTEIFAAVSGTGSNYGAPRLQRDVLRHEPDLLFVEFAVNDGTGSPRRGPDGGHRASDVGGPSADGHLRYTTSGPWRQLDDPEYPFEFSVPVDDPHASFRFFVTGRTPDGREFHTAEAIIGASP